MTHLETAVPPGTDGADEAEDDQPDPASTAILLPSPLEGGIDPACYSARRCRCGQSMQALRSPTGHDWRCPVCGRRQKR